MTLVQRAVYDPFQPFSRASPFFRSSAICDTVGSLEYQLLTMRGCPLLIQKRTLSEGDWISIKLLTHGGLVEIHKDIQGGMGI